MKIALIEIGGSHDECLYSQIRFLKEKKDIFLTLVCNESLKENIKYFDGPDEYKFVSIREGSISQWLDIYDLWRFIKKQKYDQLIFNTAQGGIVKKLMMFPFGSDVKISGTIHNIGKLKKSTGQVIISRKVKKYMVLNEYLRDNLDDKLVDQYDVGVYYPIFFPDYPIMDIQKEKSEIWICIPGQVEYKRRDYESFFNKLEGVQLQKDIKFLLLGRCAHEHGDGQIVKSRIAALGLEDRFVLWDNFIDPVEFYNRIRLSDYILPLIHKGQSSFDLYSEQISGSFNLGFGYKIPFIMHQAFQRYPDFEDTAVFYNKNNMFELINSIGKPDPSEYYRTDKWSFVYQKEQYLKQLSLSS